MGHRTAFSLKKALVDAVGFLPAAWSGAWLILLAMLAALIAAPLALDYAPRAVAAAGLLALLWLLKLMALGALYRLAVFGQAARIEGLGLGGIQLGMPELRLLIAQIAIILFLLLIAATLMTVFMLAFSLSGLGDGYVDTMSAISAVFERAQGLDRAFIAYTVLAAILLVVLSVRLSLMYAASVAERRVVTLNALGLSEGAGFKLLLGVLLVAAPAPIAALALHKLAASHAAMIAHTTLSLIAVAVILPLSAGFFASGYRQMRLGQAK